MKVTQRQLRRIIQEELEDILAVEDVVDIEPEEDAWAGGENLIEPIDYQEITTGDPVEPGIEIAPIVAEDYGASPEGPLDANGDGILSPEELYLHFDLDGDGVVTVDDYVAHVNWHCSHPEAMEREGIVEEVPDEVMLAILQSMGVM